jgi:hypothetical protein
MVVKYIVVQEALDHNVASDVKESMHMHRGKKL